MQIQKVSNNQNNQNFGMALKKPKGISAKHIDEIFRGDTEGATKFAEKYMNVKNNQRKNKVCDIIFNDNMITDRDDHFDAKLQYSINVIGKRSLKNITNYPYHKSKLPQDFDTETIKKNLIKSLEDADAKATEIAALVKAKIDSSSILKKAYNSGSFSGKSKKWVLSHDAKEYEILNDIQSSKNQGGIPFEQVLPDKAFRVTEYESKNKNKGGKMKIIIPPLFTY